MTKAAVIQLTKAMAIELARYNIRVNAIAPGYVLTEMNRSFFESAKPNPSSTPSPAPHRRARRLDGCLAASGVERIVSFMTGSVITIDGGHSLGV